MGGVKSTAQDISMPAKETVEVFPKHSDPYSGDGDDTGRESLSQPSVNFLADFISQEDYSQAPTSNTTVAISQQPSPEFLMSLGIKVRDFAYENTLPAIVPVPRVPRQVQPAPRALKRFQREWDDEKSPLNGLSPVRPLSEPTGSKKPRFLDRRPTEPLQEPVVGHTRTLERITIKNVCSILSSSPRIAIQTTSRARFPASPPTSPLTPPPSHLAPQDPEVVGASSTFPFVVHVENSSMSSESQLVSESRPVSFHPVLYTRCAVGSHSSPVPSPPRNMSPTPLIRPLLEMPSPAKESRAVSRVRKRHHCGTPPPAHQYQLRQRPVPPSRVSNHSRCLLQVDSASKSPRRRSRRVR